MIEETSERYRAAWQLLDAGKIDDALGLYSALLSDEIPADVRIRVHNNLGSLYHDKLGDLDKGREHLRLAAELADGTEADPPSFFHWRVYAWVALRDHQWSEAISAAGRVIDTAPTDFERRNLHVLLAAANANIDQTDEALSHLRSAATAGPEPPGADRWPYRVSDDTDPLGWARENRTEFFARLGEDQELGRFLHK